MLETLLRTPDAVGAGTRSGGFAGWVGRYGPGGLVLVTMLITTVLVITALLVISLREEALDTAETNIVRVNYVLAESLDRLFQTMDLTLEDMAREIVEARSPSFVSSDALRERLRQRMTGLPASERLAVFDATGRVLNDNSDRPLTATSITDRPYFIEQRDHPGLGMRVSVPLQSRADQKWTFVLSRRISGPDGAFLGLVSTAVNFSYLDTVFSAVAPESGARVTLLRDDLIMLFRHPSYPEYYGHSLAETPTYHGIFGNGAVAGSGRFIGVLTHEQRVVAARRLAHYPFVISIAVPEATVLMAWRRIVVGIGVAAITVVLGLVALLVLLWRQHGRRTVAEAALVRSNNALAEERSRLWSVVDAASDGFWEWHLDTGMVDWSERCCALMEMPAAGGVLHIEQVLAMIVAEDRDRYQTAMRRLVDAGLPLDVEARWHTIGGSQRWIASRARLIRGDDGRPVRMIGANSDVTERKLLEVELAEPLLA